MSRPLEPVDVDAIMLSIEDLRENMTVDLGHRNRFGHTNLMQLRFLCTELRRIRKQRDKLRLELLKEETDA